MSIKDTNRTIKGRGVMHEIIARAIVERKVVLAYYSPGNRVIIPCAFGRGSRGQLLLRAFQRSGASAGGEPVRWKLFSVPRISSFELTDEVFEEAPIGYRRGDSAMSGGIIHQI